MLLIASFASGWHKHPFGTLFQTRHCTRHRCVTTITLACAYFRFVRRIGMDRFFPPEVNYVPRPSEPSFANSSPSKSQRAFYRRTFKRLQWSDRHCAECSVWQNYELIPSTVMFGEKASNQCLTSYKSKHDFKEIVQRTVSWNLGFYFLFSFVCTKH